MKKRMIIPALLAATMFYGCASSDENMNTTAMEEDMTMSETQTMAGDTDYDYDVVADPSDTYTEIFNASQTPVDYDEMFKNIDDTEKYDVLSLAKMDPNLSTFVKLAEKANLVNDLQRLDSYTLFAPTNQAFAKVPKEKLEKLLMPDNKALLMKVLQAHVLPSEVSSLQLEDNSRIQMTEDTYIPVEVGVNNTNIRVGGAQVVRNDIEASNGVIHVIDSVILPSEDARESDMIGY